MQIIVGTRGSGKTTNLINSANTLYEQHERVIVITSSMSYKEVLLRNGLNANIPVMTIENYKYYTGTDDYIFIDNLEYFLAKIFNLRFNHNKITVSLGLDENEFRLINQNHLED